MRLPRLREPRHHRRRRRGPRHDARQQPESSLECGLQAVLDGFEARLAAARSDYGE
ncbi:hypothetical protein ABZV31_07685 [Streptomyces sp. NPDC005202]|uniref:hypothetical protein n=1 Tax=Streptomyces sp. NPDC005202 TaxID=3157021 RepID=UPI0033BE565B